MTFRASPLGRLAPKPTAHTHHAQVELELHALKAQYASCQRALEDRDSTIGHVTDRLQKAEAAHACCGAIQASRLQEIEAAKKELDVCRHQRETALRAAQAEQEQMMSQVVQMVWKWGGWWKKMRGTGGRMQAGLGACASVRGGGLLNLRWLLGRWRDSKRMLSA